MRKSIFSLGLLVLAGCTSLAQETSIKELATTPIPTSTPTTMPSPTITITPIVTATPTKIPPPTWTPLPKVEAPARVIRSLWVDNGGCRLPCWWGITPGETSWDKARQFLESLKFEFEGVSSDNFPNSQGFIGFYWNQKSDDSNAVLLTVYNGKVQMIGLGPETSALSFQYYQLLTEYGHPDQLLMKREESCLGYRENECPYFILMYYEKHHFLAYFILHTPILDKPLMRCFEIDYGPSITTWSENEIWDEERLQFDTYQSVEEITTIDEKTFYERFRNINVEPCIELKE